ncbi:hypothetical protein LCGC14_2305790 [marine sediment metagenome]|uniref:Uncharacterized protein n=1 Tax=marine sediment metagenome TaxID=412755 RepID=A0A0F9D9L9_9ZZZZ
MARQLFIPSGVMPLSGVMIDEDGEEEPEREAPTTPKTDPSEAQKNLREQSEEQAAALTRLRETQKGQR